MASYEELALADMANQIPDPRAAADLYPEAPGPLRLTVRPAGFAAPTNDLAQGQPWGAQGSEASRDEATFQQGIRATPWFSEFQQKHGEEPNLNTPDYDYRKAWAAGSRPNVRDPGDQMLHWSSEFKGENHPNRYVNGVDTITGQQQRKLPWLPRTEQQLGGLGRGLGALVEGARDWWNAPPAQPAQPAQPNRSPMGAPPLATPGPQRGSFAPVNPMAGVRPDRYDVPKDPPLGLRAAGGVVDMAREALQVPHNMIEAGRVINSPAATPQQVQQARAQEGQGVAETAMNLWGFNAPFSALRGGITAGVFGGRIEPGRKAFAERLEQQGASKQEIWKQAGLTRFADNQWRQEIPDIAASYRGGVNDIAARIFDQQNPTRVGKYRTDGLDWPSVAAKQEAERKIAQGELVLGDVIPHHPELYALYPELRQMPVSHDAMMEASGGYYRRSKEHPQGQIVYREEPDKSGKVTPRGLTFKTLIHEIEHAIANIEGFAKGSSAMVQNVDVAGSPARQMFDKMIAQFPQDMRTPQVIAETRSRAAHAAYNASAGEIPAKVAEIRADFTRDQLKAIEPTSMFRPKLEKQNVEYNPMYDPSAPDAKLGSVLNPQPIEMQAASRPSPLLRPPGKTMKDPAWLPVKPTVLDPRRVFSPGVYENPRVVAEKAAENVAAEHPALKELFGVTRADLYDISQQGRRKGNMEPEIHAPKKPGESYVAEGLATPQNEQRILDTLGEGLKHRGLREGMVPWYVMDPMFQHMVKLVGKEQAIKDYQRFNATTAPFSASSDVMTELNRGTAANMYAKRGDYDTFHRFAGADRQNLPPGFPADMSAVGGHAYHAIQSDPVVRWLQTGKHGYGKEVVKIPTYHAASGVPETGFQTRWPVPDAHFARGVGAADVRDTAKPGVAMKGAEYRSMAPWYREKIAEPIGIEAVPAQALQWGTMSRATGVDTPIGAGKLELLSQRIWERAKELGIDPKVLRDQVLRGDQHAVGLLTAGGAGAAGLGSLVDPSRYEAR